MRRWVGGESAVRWAMGGTREGDELPYVPLWMYRDARLQRFYLPSNGAGPERRTMTIMSESACHICEHSNFHVLDRFFTKCQLLFFLLLHKYSPLLMLDRDDASRGGLLSVAP